MHQPPNALPAVKIPQRRNPMVLPQKGQGMKMETIDVMNARMNRKGAGEGFPTISMMNAPMKESQKTILTRLYFL